MAEVENLSMVDRVDRARQQILQLTGSDPVSVSGLARVDDGWELMVDVVEVERIPDTASLLATYRVTTDERGEVSGYERVRRFNRSEAD
jgi:Gas vesicle synthesis protein GvpO